MELNKIAVFSIFFILGTTLKTTTIHAYPHNGEIFQLKQPDGSSVSVKVWGDEHFQDVESMDGYTLIRDPETGWICYAIVSDNGNEYISTGTRYQSTATSPRNVTPAPPPTLPKHARISRVSAAKKAAAVRAELAMEVKNIDLSKFKSHLLSKQAAPAAEEPDTVVALTLLIDFPDLPGDEPKENIDAFFNEPGNGNYGSINDYFWDVSNNHLVYINVVTEYFTVSRNKSYYDTPNGYGPVAEMLTDALEQLEESGFDFSQLSTDSRGRVIALNALYAGRPDNGWANGLWPHSGSYRGGFSSDGVSFSRYQLTSIGNGVSMSTICHENGHMLFGWADLYSYDNHSNGVGRFCIMCNSSNPPQQPNAFFRSLENWITITDISNSPLGTVYSHVANSHTAFFYSGEGNGSSNELYMIEARVQEGWSRALPDEGLAIWHVDEEGSNSSSSRPELYVGIEQADGLFQLENRQNSGGRDDLFHAGNNDRFADQTDPSARWHNGSNSGIDIANISEVGDVMTFTLGPEVDPFIEITSPNNGELQWEQGKTYAISWFDNIEEDVSIELLRGETAVQTIASSTESTSPFSWTIPLSAEVGTDYKIRITSTTDPSLADESDAMFGIVAPFVIDTFPYTENFDAFSSGEVLRDHWEQASDDELDWLVISGPTPSKVHPQGGGTGPDNDHTSSSDRGNYIYVEASGDNFPNKRMDLLTPPFNLVGLTEPVMTVWVHMFSTDGHMGKLSIDINVNGNWTDDVQQITGDHGDEWFLHTLNLVPFKGELVQIRFRGTTGTDYDSDICLDDFSISENSVNIKALASSIPVPRFIKRGNCIYLQNGTGTARIYSLDGKLWQSWNTARSTVVDMAALPRGVYFLKMGNRTFKFMRLDN